MQQPTEVQKKGNMREIKFRAMAIQQDGVEDHELEFGIGKGDWVFGHYYYSRLEQSGIIVTQLLSESGGESSGLVECHVRVDHKTKGQYSGLKDIEEKRIYEGDIVKFECNNPLSFTTYDEIGYIIFDQMLAKFCIEYHDDYRAGQKSITSVYMQKPKIIGNIYDNPDLLEDNA